VLPAHIWSIKRYCHIYPTSTWKDQSDLDRVTLYATSTKSYAMSLYAPLAKDLTLSDVHRKKIRIQRKIQHMQIDNSRRPPGYLYRTNEMQSTPTTKPPERSGAERERERERQNRKENRWLLYYQSCPRSRIRISIASSSGTGLSFNSLTH
jgi:hypothetical protein